MRWLVVIALAGACGSSKQVPQCGPDSYELEAYLKSLETTPPPFTLDSAALVERTDLQKRTPRSSSVMQVGARDFRLVGGLRMPTADATLESLREMMPGVGPSYSNSDQLILAIDDNARWESVVVATKTASANGFTRIGFLFAGKPVTPPPRTRIDDDLDALSGDASSRATSLAKLMQRVVESCTELRKLFGQAYDKDVIVRHLREALLACDCKVDMGALRSVMFRMLAVQPLTLAEVALARTGKRLELPPNTPWRDANRLITKSGIEIWLGVPGDQEPPPEAGIDSGVDPP